MGIGGARRTTTILATLLGATFVGAGSASGDLALIPYPRALERGEGAFTLDASTAVVSVDALAPAVSALREALRPATGFALPSAPEARENTIHLVLDPSLPEEGYRLDVDTTRVELERDRSKLTLLARQVTTLATEGRRIQTQVQKPVPRLDDMIETMEFDGADASLIEFLEAHAARGEAESGDGPPE